MRLDPTRPRSNLLSVFCEVRAKRTPLEQALITDSMALQVRCPGASRAGAGPRSPAHLSPSLPVRRVSHHFVIHASHLVGWHFACPICKLIPSHRVRLQTLGPREVLTYSIHLLIDNLQVYLPPTVGNLPLRAFFVSLQSWPQWLPHNTEPCGRVGPVRLCRCLQWQFPPWCLPPLRQPPDRSSSRTTLNSP
jgi:hypothetical protein